MLYTRGDVKSNFHDFWGEQTASDYLGTAFDNPYNSLLRRHFWSDPCSCKGCSQGVLLLPPEATNPLQMVDLSMVQRERSDARNYTKLMRGISAPITPDEQSIFYKTAVLPHEKTYFHRDHSYIADDFRWYGLRFR